jgi:hypothetical protein
VQAVARKFGRWHVVAHRAVDRCFRDQVRDESLEFLLGERDMVTAVQECPELGIVAPTGKERVRLEHRL